MISGLGFLINFSLVRSIISAGRFCCFNCSGFVEADDLIDIWGRGLTIHGIAACGRAAVGICHGSAIAGLVVLDCILIFLFRATSR